MKVKQDKYLRDITQIRYNPNVIDVGILYDYDVTFVGKMRIVAKNKKEVQKEIENFKTMYPNALNELKVSNIKVKQLKRSFDV